MSELMMPLAQWIAGSAANELVIQWLRTVPGLPPILQTLHLLGVAVLMGSVVLISMRVLGLAVPSQQIMEMYQRLLPWFTGALIVLLCSALPFVLARPYRYLLNPVFMIKMGLLLLALMGSLLFFSYLRRHAERCQKPGKQPWPARGIALVCLLLWLILPLAGRWIAYSDYLFWAG